MKIERKNCILGTDNELIRTKDQNRWNAAGVFPLISISINKSMAKNEEF